MSAPSFDSVSAKSERYAGVFERYRNRLPVCVDASIVSLNEGNTPLIRLKNVTRNLDVDIDVDIEVYAKYEGLNPTGSFKDRGMTVAVSMAVDQGSRAIICASTGNTSAAAAAYAARAGLAAYVLIPEGNIALGKLAQAMMHGAKVIQIEGNFDAGMELVKAVAEQTPVTIVNSINPYRLQGQKTAAFEIVDELGNAPDLHYLPVGNAGNISAYWMGYCEYQEDGVMDTTPRMVGYQASGAAPFVLGEMIDDPETVATAIRIGRPQSWQSAWGAKDASGGWFDKCSDDQILAAQKVLAEQEGIFCEPASAVSVAGLLQDIGSGKISSGSQIV
ncbi:MAG: threonine synthase, partial [Gammaproteobacteria bacterium]|nr:threonine synthase [Gammaproteobacteria bacterium]